MRCLPIMILVLGLTAAAFAKPEPSVRVNLPQARQGGDTIATAFAIPLIPFSDTGTTAGYSDDYDETCPYGGSDSPDVVYSFTPAQHLTVAIDLCGSAYDTKVYVYDANLTLIACNDDYYVGDPCGSYVSLIDYVHLAGGQPYFIVVDGYGGDFGDYVLQVSYPPFPCDLTCPDGGVDEGEPPLADGAPLSFNCGCQCADPDLMSALVGDAEGELIHCARNGWFELGGSTRRDDDYLFAHIGAGGAIHIEVDAEHPLYLFQTTTDCSGLSVIQMATAGPCSPATMDIAGAPGELVWLFAAAATFDSPTGETPYEFDYTLRISGLLAAVATEQTSWGSVKALYR